MSMLSRAILGGAAGYMWTGSMSGTLAGAGVGAFGWDRLSGWGSGGLRKAAKKPFASYSKWMKPNRAETELFKTWQAATTKRSRWIASNRGARFFGNTAGVAGILGGATLSDKIISSNRGY